MDSLLKELEGLEKKGNLSKSIEDVQKTIDLLVGARNTIAADPKSTPLTLAKLQSSVKQSFDKVNEDLKSVHGGLNKYSKALEKKFKDKPLPNAETDAISSHPALVNRAIAMHLLREGQFGVASTFIEEANKNPPRPTGSSLTSTTHGTHQHHDQVQRAWEDDFATGTGRSEILQLQFAEMYHILHELRQAGNLEPAIAWARVHSVDLEHRGSNLEFELCRLQFVRLFMSDDEGNPPPNPPTTSNRPSSDNKSQRRGSTSSQGPLNAWAYARGQFAPFQSRYAREIQQLLGAMAFWPNMRDSPYWRTFNNDSAEEEMAASFTREFCSLLGLSADSPLYVAATAGAIALPRMLKMQSIMKEKRTEWTTQHELPIEIPLPPSYHFHSIFVCPVSKEQGTDQNPPMMMPCGHVIAKESLEKISKGARFKCPYCPSESHPRDARKVFL